MLFYFFSLTEFFSHHSLRFRNGIFFYFRSGVICLIPPHSVPCSHSAVENVKSNLPLMVRCRPNGMVQTKQRRKNNKQHNNTKTLKPLSSSSCPISFQPSDAIFISSYTSVPYYHFINVSTRITIATLQRSVEVR